MANSTDCQKTIERIECAIRHIHTSTGIELWAKGIAIAAMESQICRIDDFDKKIERASKTTQPVLSKEDMI